MTIITIIPDLVRGGGEQVATQIHLGLLERGVNGLLVYVAGPSEGPPNSIWLGGTHAKDMRAWSRLRGVVRQHRTAVVHAHMFPSQLAVRMFVPNKYLAVTTEHSTHNRRRRMPLGRQIDSIVLRRFDSIICISDAVCRSIKAWLPSLSRRAIVAENGIDLGRFRLAPSGAPRNRIVSVGRLESVKGFDVAIRAIACLYAAGARVTYDIFGEGPFRTELEQLISTAGLSEIVKLRGRVSDVEAHLPNYGIMLMPSRWEGFGLAAVEAMACGLPVIATDVTGLGDIVLPSCGVHCRVESHDDLAAALSRLLLLPDAEYFDMRTAAAQRAKEFSFERTMDKYLSIYKDLHKVHAIPARIPSGIV